MKYVVTSGFIHSNGEPVDVGDVVEIENAGLAKHYQDIGRIAPYEERKATPAKSEPAAKSDKG